MTNFKITVPDMGDFKDVEVIEVLVKNGQTINKNDSIITLESDKSSVEVPSTHSGKIEKVNVSVGDKINKGDLILTLESNEKKEEIKKEEPKEKSKIETPIPRKEDKKKILSHQFLRAVRVRLVLKLENLHVSLGQIYQ